MANELTVSTRLQFTPTNPDQQKHDPALSPISVSVTDQDMTVAIIDVADSEGEYTPPASVAQPGYCRLKNLDGAATISVGPATTVYMADLKPKEEALFRFTNGVTSLFHIADAGTPKLQIELVAD